MKKRLIRLKKSIGRTIIAPIWTQKISKLQRLSDTRISLVFGYKSKNIRISDSKKMVRIYINRISGIRVSNHIGFNYSSSPTELNCRKQKQTEDDKMRSDSVQDRRNEWIGFSGSMRLSNQPEQTWNKILTVNF